MNVTIEMMNTDEEEGRLKHEFLMTLAMGVSSNLEALQKITMFRDLPDTEKLSLFVQGTMTGLLIVMLDSFDPKIPREETAAAVKKHVDALFDPIVKNIDVMKANGTLVTERSN